MASASPTKVSIGDFKSKVLRNPALTTHYLCNFTIPGGQSGFISKRGINLSSDNLTNYVSLSCSEASLPGSSLATIDINNDYHGISEKHAYRRLYDDRSDFTFYVDSENYYVIRLFEAWIGYAVNEQLGGSDLKKIKRPNYSYRVNYPTNYYAPEMSITKFEKDYSSRSLKYEFINAFPISINSMPISYDSSQLLKCTVSFTYSRYAISPST
jgi:hypothetical protein